jgi:GAF domain-containing protein
MNKSAIPSIFTSSDASHLQAIAQAAASALHQLQQLQSSRRAITSLSSLARCMPLLASCASAPAVAEFVECRLPSLIHARSARLLMMNHHNPDATTWRMQSGDEDSPTQLRLPCKSMWSAALRVGHPTIVNDTRADPRFGRECSFGCVMLVPIYSSDSISDNDEFGSYVLTQGSAEKVNALGIIEVKDKLLHSGFTEMDAVVAENLSKAIAAVLQREDVRMYMRDSDLEGRLELTGTFTQQVRQAESLIVQQSGFERCYIFLSHNDMLSYRDDDGRISVVDPATYPFNVCCTRHSIVVYPNVRNTTSSINWVAAIGRIAVSLYLDSSPHSFMVLPLLGGSQNGPESMPFGVAVCLQWSGEQKHISSTVRARALSLATSASLVLQAAHADVTEKQRAVAYSATVELGRKLHSAAVVELCTRQTAFESTANSIVSHEIPAPDTLPVAFLRSAQSFTATACGAQLALVYVTSTPPSGGDRLVCLKADGSIDGQPCGRGLIGSVYRGNSPLVIHNAPDDRRFVISIDSPAGIHVQNMILVPLPCAANDSIAGGVLALFNVALEMMHFEIGLQAACNAASAIADSITFLISEVASSSVRHRLQNSISSLMSCLQRTLNVHASAALSDDVLRNGCAALQHMIQCDAINVYTLRPGVDIMFPFQLPHHGSSTAPSKVHFPIEGLVGLAARSGAIIASTSPLDDPSYSPDIDRSSAGREPASVLCIPIKTNPEYMRALEALAVARGACYTFGDLTRTASDNADSRMQVDLWLPPSFASTLTPPLFSGASSLDQEQNDSPVAVVELVIHKRKSGRTFKNDDVIVASLFASQLAIAVRNSRQLMQVDTVTAYCHPMLASLTVDSPGGGKEQLHVIESLRRTALGLCRTQFVAIFYRETSGGRDELVSVEWLSAVSGLSLSNLLDSHPNLSKRFASALASREQERRQRCKEELDALEAGGLGNDSGSVPSVFDGTSASSKLKHANQNKSGSVADDLDVPIRLRVPVNASHGGLVGTCAVRGAFVVMQRPGDHANFKSGIDDRHSLVTKNEVCAPICDCNGKVVAVLQLINHPGGSFSQEDLQAIKVFSLIAAEALKEAEEANTYRQWLTFTRGVRKILQLSVIPDSVDRESNIWQTCAVTLAGMMQCAAYCFILCSYDDRRWTRYRNSGPIVRNAKRSGLPSQCIRCGDLQIQDAMSRKYSDQATSDSQSQGYIDLLSDSDDDVSSTECVDPAAPHSSDGRFLLEDEQSDNSGDGASSSCGLLCVPLTDFHMGRGESSTVFPHISFSFPLIFVASRCYVLPDYCC